MKVLNVEYQNFKNLENVNIAVEGRSMIVVGKNQAGKSSVLDTIFDILSNGDMPPEPIKQGEKEAYIGIVVGDDNKQYTVTKTFTEKNKKGYLKISTPDGATFSSPVETMRRLFGTISFDMDDLLASKNNEEMSVKLKKFLNIDTDKLDTEYETKYKERAAVNKEVKDLKEVINQSVPIAATIEQIDADIKTKQDELEKIKPLQENLNALYVREQKGIDLKNSTTANLQKARDSKFELQTANEVHKKSIADKEELIKKLQHEISLESQIIIVKEEEIVAKINAEKEQSDLLVQIEDTFTAIKQEIEAAKEKISNVPVLKLEIESFERTKNDAIKLEKTKADLLVKEDEATKLTNRLDAIKKEKADVFKKYANGAVSFSDDGEVLHDGLPLHKKQLNTATLIEVAIELVLNSNPKLKSIKFDASQIDNPTLEKIMERVNKLGFQAFIERVDLDGGDLQINFIEK
jgi:hypothetical protein